MVIQIERRLFTVAEYEQMIRDGILKEGERIELIEGEIAKMSPINHLHAACVASLEFLFGESIGRRAYVWLIGLIFAISPSISSIRSPLRMPSRILSSYSATGACARFVSPSLFLKTTSH